MSGNEKLWFGGESDVPDDVAVCPECGSKLDVRSMAWDEETGAPIDCDLDINCKQDAFLMAHRYWQSDWQSIIDAVRKWSGAIGPDMGQTLENRESP